MKHKNWIWRAFLIAFGVLVLFYGGKAAYKSYQYSLLTEQTPALAVHWSIKKKSSDAYILTARQQFSVFENKFFEGTTIFSHPIYWNEWAANEALKEQASKQWLVWYAPSNPELSSLQKKFPIQECLSGLALLGIFLYFLWVDHYAAKFRS